MDINLGSIYKMLKRWGVVISVPVLIGIGVYFFNKETDIHKANIAVLQSEIDFLKQQNSVTSYSNVWNELTAQRKLYEQKLESINQELKITKAKLKDAGTKVAKANIFIQSLADLLNQKEDILLNLNQIIQQQRILISKLEKSDAIEAVPMVDVEVDSEELPDEKKSSIVNKRPLKKTHFSSKYEVDRYLKRALEDAGDRIEFLELVYSTVRPSRNQALFSNYRYDSIGLEYHVDVCKYKSPENSTLYCILRLVNNGPYDQEVRVTSNVSIVTNLGPSTKISYVREQNSPSRSVTVDNPYSTALLSEETRIFSLGFRVSTFDRAKFVTSLKLNDNVEFKNIRIRSYYN